MLAVLLIASERADSIADEETLRSRSTTGKVVVTLRSHVSLETGVIHVSDVAMVSGGDAALREQIKRLDLEESVAPGESLTISTTQIEFRLKLAGIGSDEFVVRGMAVRVMTESEVKKVNATTQLRTTSASDGKASRSPTSNLTESSTSVTRAHAKPIPQTQRCDEQIAAASQTEGKKVLVKRNDRVRLVAKTGPVSIVTVGEAQQDGREGETIRVLNATTKTPLRGRVTGINEVEIAF